MKKNSSESGRQILKDDKKSEIIEIKSAQNDFVKYCARLKNSKFRKQEGLILADGIKTLEGFVSDGIEFEYLIVNKNELNKLGSFKAKKVIIVPDSILSKISSLTTPQGAIGIIKEPVIDKKIFFNLDRIALIENIKDPGNLGTIIRSAAAFSIQGLILFGECVDLYNPKTIRSSAQNIFKIPIVATSDIEFIKDLRKSHKIISTVVKSENNFFDCKFPQKFILALGSEAFGLSDKILNMTDIDTTIEMDNNVESLNLAVCASIAFALTKNKLN